MKTTEKKPTHESRLPDDQGLGAEDVTRNDSTAHLLWQAFQIRPKLNRAALDVLTAIHELGPTAYEQDIATHAEMSERHVRRCLRRLEAAFLVVTTQRWNGGQTKNTYRVTGQNCPVGRWSDRTKESAHDAGQKSPPHDDMHDEEMSKKLDLLNFIDWGERLKRAGQKHCSVDYARSWRKWWDRRDFGRLTNPAGFANDEMKQGHPAPVQMNLPATSDDLTTPTGHTYTQQDLELINSNPPVDGMRFNPTTGTWT